MLCYKVMSQMGNNRGAVMESPPPPGDPDRKRALNVLAQRRYRKSLFSIQNLEASAVELDKRLTVGCRSKAKRKDQES
jgi:hypothetical protein